MKKARSLSQVLWILLLAALPARAQSFHPYLVRDLTPGSTFVEASRTPFTVRTVGDVMFFGVDAPTSALWRTDGTATGTHAIYDGLRDRDPWGLMRTAVHEGRVFYPLRHGDTLLLYSSDGTTAGTRFVAPVRAFVGGATCAPGKLCFSAGGSRIGVTDGTAGGTSILEQVSVTGDQHLTWDWEMTSFRGRAFFNTYDEVNGRCQSVVADTVLCGELWASDGTAAGTRLFKDLNPGPWPSGAAHFFVSRHGRLFFEAIEAGSSWCHEYASDGTPEGTVALTPGLRHNCDGGSPGFLDMGDLVYYRGLFTDIMESDGTPQGTRSLRDKLGWPASREMWDMAAVGNRLLIEVYERENSSRSLWAYDGTGAARIADSPEGIAFLGVLAGRMWYATRAAALGGPRELWSTGGTAGSTRFEFVLPEAGGTVHGLAATPGKLFYVASNDLFVTDGSPGGTRRISMPVEVARSSIIWDLLSHGGRLFFTEEFSGRHFASDGTAAGTVPLGLARTGEPMFVRGGHVYFRNPGGELYVTDGTPAGTRRAAEWLGVAEVFGPPVFLGGTAIFAGNGGNDAFLLRRDAGGTVAELGPRGRMTDFAAGQSRVYFWLHDLPSGTAALMTTDGTSAGTNTARTGFTSGGEILPVGAGAMFGAAAAAGSQTLALWTTDGTEAGTRVVEAVGTAGQDEVIPIMEWRGLAIFAKGDRSRFEYNGDEVWRSDGTAEGTYRLGDATFLWAVPDGDTLTLLHKAIDSLDWEVWTSDGTSAGTTRRASGAGRLVGGPFRMPNGELSFAYSPERHVLHVRGTRTNALTVIDLGETDAGTAAFANGRLFYNGCRGKTGCELWAVPLDGSASPGIASVRVEHRGTEETPGGRAAVFRVSMSTTAAERPSVVVSTVDGSLKAGQDYEPLSIEVLFPNDEDVTISIPLRDGAAGSMGVVLTSPRNAVIQEGSATARIQDRRRRAARHGEAED